MKTNATLRRWFRSQKDLFRLVASYSLDPAGWIHPDHLRNILSRAIFDQLVKLPRGRMRLSKLLLQRLALQETCFFDFESPRIRLCLMEPTVLQQLLAFAGAAYNFREIRMAVRKEEVAALKKNLGEATWTFAVKRVPFLNLPKPRIQAPAAVEGEALDLHQKIFLMGKTCMELCLAGAPRPVVNRLRLKFPSSFSWDFRSAVSPDEQETAWNFLRHLLLNEIQPKLAPCFS